MKKNVLYILLLLCLFLGPIDANVSAEEFSFNVYAEPSIVEAPGDNVKLKFVISAGNELITNCEFNVTVPDGVKYVGDESPNEWIVDNGSKKYVLESIDGVSQGVIMNSIYTVKSNSTITVSNIICSTAQDKEFVVEDDVKVDVKIADTVNIKVDGVPVSGGVTNPLAADKTSFVFSATSVDTNIQSNIKIEIGDTVTGSKTLCTGQECTEINVNFTSENFCDSANCKTLKPKLGEHILINVYIGSVFNRSFYVIKELTNVQPIDGSLKYLKVWGKEVPLEEGRREYTVNVAANATDYSVVAELSDPDNFEWHDEDKPSKYNFVTDTVTLILVPKNSELLGAEEKVYVIHIVKDGEPSAPSSSSSDSSESPSSSSSDSSYIPPSSSSSNGGNVSNPHTSGISQFVIAIVLFVSLGATLSLYKKNMEEYR